MVNSLSVVGEKVCVQDAWPATCHVLFKAENCGIGEGAPVNRSVRKRLTYIRSFLKPLSKRAKYCVPFRIDVAPNDPVSIMGVEQGMFSTTGVPQIGLPDASLPKTSCAV